MNDYMNVRLYVHEMLCLRSWVYFLCCVSYLRFFLSILINCTIKQLLHISSFMSHVQKIAKTNINANLLGENILPSHCAKLQNKLKQRMP